MVGLGEAEAADPLAAGQLGQELLALRLGAELEDGQHHQAALHAHHAAVAAVHALDLACDEAVADVVQPGAAVLLRDGGAQQAQLAHLAEDAGVGFLLAEGLEHARAELVLAVGAGGVAHLALVVGELLVQQQRVVPVEACLGGHGGCVLVYNESGMTAVTSISTWARSSISATTCTAVIAMPKSPMSSRKAAPISRARAM